MKRRLEIARGFLHTPKILFLDEPTLGLDPQSRNQLWTHVKHLNATEGVTVFLTTHYMDEADRVAQRIAIIDHGKIVAQGTPAELKEQTGSETLEQAFLALTGSSVRDESLDFRGPDAAVRESVEEITMEAIYALWLREVKRYSRSPVQIVVSLGQPMLYLLVLGFGLGPVFQKAGSGSYIQFVAPGVIGMSILFSAIFSGVGLLWDRQFGFLKETLVAPVPRTRIMLGRTLGGATVAVIQGTLVMMVCLIAGFRPANCAATAGGLRLHADDCDGFRRDGHGDRFRAPGHAGLPADHELPGDADLLPLRRPVPADRPSLRPARADQPGSALLRDRRHSRIADQCASFRAYNGCGGAVRRGVCVACDRHLSLLPD